MKSTVLCIHLAFAAVAYAVGSFEVSRQGIKREHSHTAVHEHNHKAVIRREPMPDLDNRHSDFEARQSSKMKSKPSAPKGVSMAGIHHTAEDSTLTATLSAAHIMAPTIAKGLAPPSREFGTTTMAMAQGSTSQQPGNPLEGFRTANLPAYLSEDSNQEIQSVTDNSANDMGSATTGGPALPLPPNFQPYYYVVTGADIPEFNGVYWMTTLVVAGVRCQRTFAKGGPDNTEYTLGFTDSSGAQTWSLQSLIDGQTLEPYVGSDDGSCSPESAYWQKLGAESAILARIGVPNVARSLTYSTTTASTTTATTTTTTTTTNSTEG